MYPSVLVIGCDTQWNTAIAGPFLGFHVSAVFTVSYSLQLPIFGSLKANGDCLKNKHCPQLGQDASVAAMEERVAESGRRSIKAGWRGVVIPVAAGAETLLVVAFLKANRDFRGSKAPNRPKTAHPATG